MERLRVSCWPGSIGVLACLTINALAQPPAPFRSPPPQVVPAPYSSSAVETDGMGRPMPPESNAGLSMPPSGNTGARDPTQPAPALQRLLVAPPKGASPGTAAPPAVPPIALRGRLIPRNGKPIAILQIGDSTVTVRQGTHIPLPGSPPTELIVDAITDQAVEVTIPALQQRFSLP